MSDADSVVDPEFSPVLALVHQRAADALEQQRRGTHAEVAPEVVAHVRALLQESRRCVERLAAGKRDLEAQEKRVLAELTEQRQVVLAEMDRELADARARMKALKEQATAAAQQQQQGGADGSAAPLSPSAAGGGVPTIHGKKIGSYLTGTSLSKESGSSAMPGDVDYWRAQAQDLGLVVEGRREALRSVEARIRSIAHLDEHQTRAHGVIGLLRQAESAERQNAAEYLRRAHALKEKAGLASNGKNAASGGGSSPSNRGGASKSAAAADDHDESTTAQLAEAEAHALQAIVNVLEPRVEVTKEAARLYAARYDQLKERLSDIEARRRQLSAVGGNLQVATKYTAETRAECQEKQATIPPPNTAIVQILRKQHGEALQRISRGADALLTLRLDVADLETQLREGRVNAIRFMHGTSDGTRERLAQLRALKGAEVVESQISAIENECARLSAAVTASSKKG